VILKEMKGVKMTEEEKRLNTLHDQPLVYMWCKLGRVG
jgi:hypothetical protein